MTDITFEGQPIIPLERDAKTSIFSREDNGVLPEIVRASTSLDSIRPTLTAEGQNSEVLVEGNTKKKETLTKKVVKGGEKLTLWGSLSATVMVAWTATVVAVTEMAVEGGFAIALYFLSEVFKFTIPALGFPVIYLTIALFALRWAWPRYIKPMKNKVVDRVLGRKDSE